MSLDTTLALLRRHHACAEGYRKLCKHLGGARAYGAQTPIDLRTVLVSNGLGDALWCLRAVPAQEEPARDRLARLFACDCAEHALPQYEAAYPGDSRPRDAIAVARRYATGAATGEELGAAAGAAGAAWEAARAAAWEAAGEAAVAARAARAAAWEAAWEAAGAAAWAAVGEAAREAEKQWQTQRFRELLESVMQTKEE